ncbi:putative pyridoxal reductase [Lachnellula suecica]|uniref:Putative pyridoxal reductase n=1 Tax=Lachnellula suecica TaxID=602035 RepID=A0A8T9BZT7_9HELO|nr:putative pyridoxal reductase [Lachnellula suecica]
MFCTDILTNGVTEACEELGITIVAYSPLGRGYLSGKSEGYGDVSLVMKMGPRYAEKNFQENMGIVSAVREMAARKSCTIAQLAINWVKAHTGTEGYPIIIPTPRATTVQRVEENTMDVHVMAEEIKEDQRIFGQDASAGG